MSKRVAYYTHTDGVLPSARDLHQQLDDDIAECASMMEAADRIGNTIKDLHNIIEDLSNERTGLIIDMIGLLKMTQTEVAQALRISPQRVSQLVASWA